MMGVGNMRSYQVSKLVTRWLSRNVAAFAGDNP